MSNQLPHQVVMRNILPSEKRR